MSTETPSDPTPERDALPTQRAVIACGRWLATCIELGWAKSDLDFLEALWWEGHDSFGNLRPFTPKPDPLASLEARWREKAAIARAAFGITSPRARTFLECADDLAALRIATGEEETKTATRQRAPDVPGATGSPRSLQTEGAKQ